MRDLAEIATRLDNGGVLRSTSESMRNLPLVLCVSPLLAFLVTTSGCASDPAKRAATLSSSVMWVDAAAAAFATYDLDHMEQVRKGSTSTDDAKTKLAVYRAGPQAAIDNAIRVAYRALAVAGPVSDTPSLVTATTAVINLVTAVEALVGTKVTVSTGATAPPQAPK